MARTYRRIKKVKQGSKRHHSFEDYSVPKWKFHSDTMTRYLEFEYCYCEPLDPANKTKRYQYKLEIIKWLKNPDHEIQFKRPRQFWDYC